jgi:hypothetical protein
MFVSYKGSIFCVLITHKEEETSVIFENGELKPEEAHSLILNGRRRVDFSHNYSV